MPLFLATFKKKKKKPDSYACGLQLSHFHKLPSFRIIKTTTSQISRFCTDVCPWSPCPAVLIIDFHSGASVQKGLCTHMGVALLVTALLAFWDDCLMFWALQVGCLILLLQTSPWWLGWGCGLCSLKWVNMHPSLLVFYPVELPWLHGAKPTKPNHQGHIATALTMSALQSPPLGTIESFPVFQQCFPAKGVCITGEGAFRMCCIRR